MRPAEETLKHGLHINVIFGMYAKNRCVVGSSKTDEDLPTVTVILTKLMIPELTGVIDPNL